MGSLCSLFVRTLSLTCVWSVCPWLSYCVGYMQWDLTYYLTVEMESQICQLQADCCGKKWKSHACIFCLSVFVWARKYCLSSDYSTDGWDPISSQNTQLPSDYSWRYVFISTQAEKILQLPVLYHNWSALLLNYQRIRVVSVCHPFLPALFWNILCLWLYSGH